MDAKAAISEIESSDLERTAKRQLRRFLANNAHLLVACVPGDVVSTLQEELQEGSQRDSGAALAEHSHNLEIAQALNAAFLQMKQQQRKRQKTIERTISGISQSTAFALLDRAGLEFDLAQVMTALHVEAIVSSPVHAIPEFEWRGRDEDKDSLLDDMAKQLQDHYCPDGVVVMCVTGLKWLSFCNRRKTLVLRRGKTDFVFLASQMLPDWVQPGMRLKKEGDIIQLLAFILALVELKSIDELAGKQGACIAQSLAEHLAANSKLPLRQKLQQDVPVLLTDACHSIMVATEPARPAVVCVTQMPDASHTAALVKHGLAQKRDALGDYLADASLAKSERWPPPRSGGDSDGGWASDDEPGSDKTMDTIIEEEATEPQSSGGGGDVRGSCGESAPKVPLDALPPCSTLDPKTMQDQMSNYLEKAMPGFIAAVHWETAGNHRN